MSNITYEAPYKLKHHIKREQGIPAEFPFKARFPAPNDIPEDAPEVFVGMDSGVGNTAFSYIELVKNPDTNAVIDFKVTNPHFKWGFDFSPSRAIYWFRQWRGFAAPLVLSAFYKGISTSFHPLAYHFLLVP